MDLTQGGPITCYMQGDIALPFEELRLPARYLICDIFPKLFEESKTLTNKKFKICGINYWDSISIITLIVLSLWNNAGFITYIEILLIKDSIF